MARTVKPEVLERIRPLVEQGLKGTALAQAAGLSERDARWYAQQVRGEAEGSARNGHGPETTPKAAIVEVSLEEFALGQTQVRVRLDPAVVDEYTEAMTEGAIFPPVVLFSEGDLYWIGDGYHRIAAARKVGYKTIRAEVREGARREALLYACSANTSHGLRRTNADKRKAVETLLNDEEWGKWSDNHIARHCGVSPTTVGTLRAALSNVDSSDGQRTYERKGQVQTMDTTHIGTRAEPSTPTNGGAPDTPQVSLVPVQAPEADDDEDGEWDEAAEDYRIYVNAWAMLSQAHAMWESNVQSGDGDRDRQFPQEVVTRMGEKTAIHIAALQETADSLQAFAAALQARLAPDAAATRPGGAGERSN